MKTYEMRDEEKEFLAGYDLTKYDRPSVAADVVVFSVMKDDECEDVRRLQEKKLKILLIRRGGFPYKGSWAMPGGFCRKGEDVIDSARRELGEETGIDDAYVKLVGVYGEPGRDPRGWVISSTYMALMNARACHLKAGDDAQDARWFTVELTDVSTEVSGIGEEIVKNEVEASCKVQNEKRYRLVLKNADSDIKLTAVLRRTDMSSCGRSSDSYDIEECEGLAFDHARIITEAVLGLREDVRRDMKLAFDLLPERFTLTELQNVYEQIWDMELTTPNFRRKIAEYVEETDAYQAGERYRPAKLFRRRTDVR
ncbi:NUDIX hydrolase [Coprococcus eutactus]|uniref:NUDIX hydrolase n=1 Tax=Coprococcus eutactus TaxID=33043 RepID=UPI0011C6EB01|nr:NUDIX domain-containing protein [Coprococcus eutactus]MCB6629569.1 NUDIX hydrolase [Coprococcus eutactus]MCG4790737.1 NUDIX hydrolase [Coprococcus eutactus]MCQ5119447.1 NUDIX hydrolase [Coprococcus eutactus]MCQ5133201.1 NUDIX hydrolase [Coprococcus eutactus]MCQ5136350.1 NUDIX hydrolase [Coprococcus eutactus]